MNRMILKESPSSYLPIIETLSLSSANNTNNPDGHNLAVSRLNNRYYVNDDNKDVYETQEEFVMKNVTVLCYK